MVFPAPPFCDTDDTVNPRRRSIACAKDEQSLFSFYAFPAAHWVQLQTSNPIESTYATVRLRRTKGDAGRGRRL